MRLKNRNTQKVHIGPDIKSTYQISTSQLIPEGSYTRNKLKKQRQTNHKRTQKVDEEEGEELKFLSVEF